MFYIGCIWGCISSLSQPQEHPQRHCRHFLDAPWVVIQRICYTLSTCIQQLITVPQLGHRRPRAHNYTKLKPLSRRPHYQLYSINTNGLFTFCGYLRPFAIRAGELGLIDSNRFAPVWQSELNPSLFWFDPSNFVKCWSQVLWANLCFSALVGANCSMWPDSDILAPSVTVNLRVEVAYQQLYVELGISSRESCSWL